VIRLLVATSALVAMEPTVAAVHRWVMHGRGWAWHRSHHRWQGRRIEANDVYPVVFAAATIATMTVGATIEGLAALVWVGAGVTGYGIAYLVVHDLFIHERLGRLPGARSRYVRWVAAAHAVHHRSGRKPYGFLLPRLATGRATASYDTGCHDDSEQDPVERHLPPRPSACRYTYIVARCSTAQNRWSRYERLRLPPRHMDGAPPPPP
jgi:beta-carotene 3-hydroxylase